MRENFGASWEVLCNFPSLVTAHEYCNVAYDHCRGGEFDEKPELVVIDTENFRHKFADRVRVMGKQRLAIPWLLSPALGAFLRYIQMLWGVNSALGQFASQSSLGFGRQLL